MDEEEEGEGQGFKVPYAVAMDIFTVVSRSFCLFFLEPSPPLSLTHPSHPTEIYTLAGLLSKS